MFIKINLLKFYNIFLYIFEQDITKKIQVTKKSTSKVSK